jgi:hypothetical protein
MSVGSEADQSESHGVRFGTGICAIRLDGTDSREQAGDGVGEIKEILADIRRDDLRAHEVINRMRSLPTRGAAAP